MNRDVDADLIDDSLAVVKDARERAPADFLVALAVLLGTGAGALLVAAALADGSLRDLFLNLAAEVLGTLITVVLIDGLWKRLEAGTSASLDETSRRLEARRGAPMTTRERQAWRSFVVDYRAIERTESPLDRVRALPVYGRRVRELEVRASRALQEFGVGESESRE